MPMGIADAQVHIWAGGTPAGLHRQVPACTAEELLAGRTRRAWTRR
jgi:hypothetical protein